jgi:hypothetical protein
METFIPTQKNAVIRRVWAMSNAWTFKVIPIKELVERVIHTESSRLNNLHPVIVDPFCGDSTYGSDGYRNDLNPENKNANSHLDARDFLAGLPSACADIVLYDPPYSLRQVVECYHGVGKNVTNTDTQSSWRAKHLDEIARILKDGGVAMCFGWNSNGVGMKRGFSMEEVLLVPHGGSKNDTICTVERKHV